MRERTISLTVQQNDFLDRVVKTGEYQNVSEAIRDAIRTLRQRRREEALSLRVIRAQLKAGRKRG
jgi:antitoxin ParD1/3/4